MTLFMRLRIPGGRQIAGLVFLFALAACLRGGFYPLPTCGDGIVQAGEVCDKADLNGMSCAALRHGNGTLACNDRCTLDFSGCAYGTRAVPFRRLIFTNEWGDGYGSPEKLQQIVQEVVFMGGDAMTLVLYSDYIEAARNPAEYGGWFPQASWDMLGVAIESAHAWGVRIYVTLPANIANDDARAERRLFGTRFDLIHRDGIVEAEFLDLAFDELYQYEQGLLAYVAGRHPKLDGIIISSPYYQGGDWTNYASYTTAMRERVLAEYGFDPIDRPEAEMIPIIHDEMREIINGFIKDARNEIKALAPEMELAVVGSSDFYRALSPADLSSMGLVDWYAGFADRDNLADFESATRTLKGQTPAIPICPIAYIGYRQADPNLAFLEQMQHVLEYGADMSCVYSHYLRGRQIGATTAYEGLHNLAH